MKKYLYVAALLASTYSFAQTIPAPDHVVIVMYENRDYSEIVGNSLAPYINSLIHDTATALFTNSNALVSGSQPNYLMLFSGSTQGVTGSTITSTQFTTCNLGASLIAAGKSFTGYSEGLPSTGFLGDTAGYYARKHNPWSNWQGTGTNQLPASVNAPLASLPADYDSLPTVAFIVPDLIDDMHTPSNTTAIAPGDVWLNTHLNSYVQWAKTHNSLFIFTYDESDATSGEHILTLFLGQYVRGGSYGESIDNYRILRTIEDFYSLPHCGTSATETPITDFWKSSEGIHVTNTTGQDVNVWPVPTSGNINVSINTNATDNIHLLLSDVTGRTVLQKDVAAPMGTNTYELDASALNRGVYYLRLSGQAVSCVRQVIIAK